VRLEEDITLKLTRSDVGHTSAHAAWGTILVIYTKEAEIFNTTTCRSHRKHRGLMTCTAWMDGSKAAKLSILTISATAVYATDLPGCTHGLHDQDTEHGLLEACAVGQLQGRAPMIEEWS
jgi:hypothetical protein